MAAFPGTTLKQARKDAEAARKMIGDGFDPVSRRPRSRGGQPGSHSSSRPALRYIELNRPRLAQHQARGTVANQPCRPTPTRPSATSPSTRSPPAMSWSCWRKSGTTKRETAGRVRQRLSAIFAYSMARGWCTSDPASPSILKVLPKAKPAVNHHPALACSDVPKVLRQVELSTAYPMTKLAFRLLALTATRSGEVRGMTWDEVDWETAKPGQIPMQPDEDGP